jgi:hypothetical protein
LILHCSESSYRSVSDTGGRIGFSAKIKYYFNVLVPVLFRDMDLGKAVLWTCTVEMDPVGSVGIILPHLDPF